MLYHLVVISPDWTTSKPVIYVKFSCFFKAIAYRFKNYKLQLYFTLPILFVLTLSSDRTVLYGSVPFSILVLSTKKRYNSFLKKVFLFQKFCFKIKLLKKFKISSNCDIKHVDLSNAGLFKQSTVPFFRGTYALRTHCTKQEVFHWRLFQ